MGPIESLHFTFGYRIATILPESPYAAKPTMTEHNKIGILTGGGDVPGLNSVIKSVVYRGSEIGRSVIGIRRGWKGLTNLDLSDVTNPTYVRELTRENTRAIDRTGGTVLHTSRTNPRRVPESKVPSHIPHDRLKTLHFDGKHYDFTPIVIENLQALGIGCLIAIGGDDTLSFASVLSAAGFPVIGIPKTMDNDVQGTEYCIGFSTAITRAKEAITRQRTTLGSHERIGIFRIFGRDAGFTAVYTAYVTSARCLIPEYPFNLERAISLLLEDKRSNPSNYAVVVVSEGAVWQQGEVQGDRRGRRLWPSQESRHRPCAGARNRKTHGRGNHGQRPHLRLAQRRAGCHRPDRGHNFRQHRRRLDSR